MRWAILTASVAALGFVGVATAAGVEKASAPSSASPAAPVERDPAALLRATSPPNSAPNRSYADPSAALMAADVDYLVREARREIAQGDRTPLWTTLAFADDFVSDRLGEARTDLANASGGIQGGLGDMFEPFLLAAEGHVDLSRAAGRFRRRQICRRRCRRCRRASCSRAPGACKKRPPITRR